MLLLLLDWIGVGQLSLFEQDGEPHTPGCTVFRFPSFIMACVQFALSLSLNCLLLSDRSAETATIGQAAVTDSSYSTEFVMWSLSWGHHLGKGWHFHQNSSSSSRNRRGDSCKRRSAGDAAAKQGSYLERVQVCCHPMQQHVFHPPHTTMMGVIHVLWCCGSHRAGKAP